ncbi:hypothetical protein SAMN04244553_3617 [Nocardia amikacinitolerans]|uniref:Uncharacterized protein n=1 Tax=Nocardia amikacinitolerans TaxID=756689 RepID=A0A285LKW8_9NOCA|nr:hypothetical protein [Nocardia amikacinitolerans]SNY84316.1 hypothetical protein SAMN04244553_3617 [Nocardia amikacinitolerans]
MATTAPCTDAAGFATVQMPTPGIHAEDEILIAGISIVNRPEGPRRTTEIDGTAFYLAARIKTDADRRITIEIATGCTARHLAELIAYAGHLAYEGSPPNLSDEMWLAIDSDN